MYDHDEGVMWCPVQGLMQAIVGAAGKAVTRPPLCYGPNCGAYAFCSQDGQDPEECVDEEEEEDDDLDLPETVQDENGEEIEVIPRTSARLDALLNGLVKQLIRDGVEFRSITCLDCDGVAMCEFAFQPKNLDGHCMAEK